jgi:hypothetical protein
MTYPREVTAQLLDYDGTPVSGTPLADGFDISFYDEWNGPGRGQVSLSLSDAGSAELLPGRYVNVLVAGTVRFTFKIEGNPEYKVIEQGEEHDQIIIVSGRGWACVFDEAITFPEFNLRFVLETTWRLFSFASPLFPNAGSWPLAHEVHEYLEGVATAACYSHIQGAPDGLAYPAPIGFPWSTDPYNLVGGTPTSNYVETFWIRPDASVMPNFDSTGFYFFRTTITTSGTTPCTFTCTGDNYFTLFLEGVPILGEARGANTDHLMWQGWKEQMIWLPSGTFTVAAVVYNISFADIGDGTPWYTPPCPAEGFAGGPVLENTGGLLMAAYIDGHSVTAPTHILSSDGNWDSYYDPTTWPGWTPGQIIQQLIDEAVARGAMTVYNSNTFDAADDSNSDPWLPAVTTISTPDIPVFSIEVGTTLLAALQSLQEQGFINWHIQPGTFILDVIRGRAPSSPSSSATLTAGTNLLGLERNATAPYANALMIQWEGGYILVEDTAAITAYGTRVEDIYSSDAPSEEEATNQGENELLRRAQGQFPAIIVVLEPTSSADCPYEGFTLGDYVTVPAPGGGTDVVRCYSISCSQDREGWANWTLELNAKLDVPERRTTELLQKIGGRNQVVRGAVT